MAIRDEAERRAVEAEFERGLSPQIVGMEWRDFGDFHYRVEVEGCKAAKIPRANLNWQSVITTISTIRGNLQRRGVTLDEWEPSPPPPTLS